MKISSVGILLILTVALVTLSGCGIVNKVRARNELNDGAKAYKERKFEEAEKHFARAKELDSTQTIADIFLARTLHQQYLAKRDTPENMKKAEQAIDIYKNIFEAAVVQTTSTPEDAKRRMDTMKSTNDAITNLILNLKGPEAQEEWVKQRSDDTRMTPEGRAEAYTLLASKEYVCANEITESESVKQTITKGNEALYVFKKPANAEDFEKLKQCAAKGTDLIDKALALDQNNDSTWSYKASLLSQQSRIAEMEGNTADKDRLTAESGKAKEKFLAISGDKQRKREEAEEAKKKKDDETKTF